MNYYASQTQLETAQHIARSLNHAWGFIEIELYRKPATHIAALIEANHNNPDDFSHDCISPKFQASGLDRCIITVEHDIADGESIRYEVADNGDVVVTVISNFNEQLKSVVGVRHGAPWVLSPREYANRYSLKFNTFLRADIEQLANALTILNVGSQVINRIKSECGIVLPLNTHHATCSLLLHYEYELAQMEEKLRGWEAGGELNAITTKLADQVLRLRDEYEATLKHPELVPYLELPF